LSAGRGWKCESCRIDRSRQLKFCRIAMNSAPRGENRDLSIVWQARNIFEIRSHGIHTFPIRLDTRFLPASHLLESSTANSRTRGFSQSFDINRVEINRIVYQIYNPCRNPTPNRVLEWRPPLPAAVVAQFQTYTSELYLTRKRGLLLLRSSHGPKPSLSSS